MNQNDTGNLQSQTPGVKNASLGVRGLSSNHSAVTHDGEYPGRSHDLSQPQHILICVMEPIIVPSTWWWGKGRRANVLDILRTQHFSSWVLQREGVSSFLPCSSAQVHPGKEESNRPAVSPVHGVCPKGTICTLIAWVEVTSLTEQSLGL